MRVEKKIQWFHTASTARFTYLFVHHKRGKEALESEESRFQDFENWAVHDCWASYFDFEQCRHALCGAQLLRELTNLIENGSKWAMQMHQFLLDLYKVSQKARVPVADKQAERDIRRLKTKQKVTTNFQTRRGAQHFARLQSSVSTLRKHAMSVFQNLINVFDNKNIAFQAG